MTRPSRRASPRQKRGWTFRHVRLLSSALVPCILTVTALPAFANSIVSRPPAGTDSFYAKYLDASGVAILGSASVDEQVMRFAQDIVTHMLSMRPDLARSMAAQHAAVAIFGPTESYTDVPEMRSLKGKIDKNGIRFEERCGGGAVKRNPVTVACERHFLDPDETSDPMVHEFGHAIQNLALDPETRAMVTLAYQHAKEANLFQRADGRGQTYLMSNEQEFFAATTTMWFNVYGTANRTNSPHGTRVDLRTYDPEMYGILAGIYPNDDWKVPHRRATP